MKKSLFTAIFNLAVSALFLNASANECCYDYEGPAEYDTLSFKAEMLVACGLEQDLHQLVTEAINSCYNAYKPRYDRAVWRDAEECGGGRGSAYHIACREHGQSLAGAIINQISVLTHKIGLGDRNKFWDLSASQIKQKIRDFCKSHQSESNSYVDAYIDDLIKMKKTFG